MWAGMQKQVWLAIGVHGYMGWQLEFGMKYVTESLKRSGMWGWQVESGMNQCGCQVGFLSMYDAEVLASGLLGVWLCGPISRNM